MQLKMKRVTSARMPPLAGRELTAGSPTPEVRVLKGKPDRLALVTAVAKALAKSLRRLRSPHPVICARRPAANELATNERKIGPYYQPMHTNATLTSDEGSDR